MFPSATPGDSKKRDLSSDNQMAVCDIYPVAKNPMVCNPGSTGGSGACSCGVARPGPPSSGDGSRGVDRAATKPEATGGLRRRSPGAITGA